MLYIRMFLVMAVSLYTSRIILQNLGIANFGIYSVVGGAIGLLGFINNSMSISVQRYLSFELGKEDLNRVNLTFNISLAIHLIIAVSLGLFFFLCGDYITREWLNIPPDKTEASTIFLKLIIISTGINILQVPFMGLIIAFEKMALLAWASIAEVILKLIVAFSISWIDYDSLIVYGYLLIAASAVSLLIFVMLSRINIRSIKIGLGWDNNLFKSLFSFATWSALGEIAWAFTIQGVSLLLNHFVGIICNAGYGISLQISGAVNKFVGSFQTALTPQIIKQYASTHVEEMLSLTFRGIRLSFFLLLLIALPAISGMNVILRLWLGVVPDYAVVFSQLIIIAAMTDSLSNLLATVAKAYGHIRRYQTIVASILFLNFPLSWLALHLGMPAWSVTLVYCLVSLTLLYVRIRLIERMLDMNILHIYRTSVLRRIFNVSVICAMVFSAATLLLDDNIGRLVLTSAMSLTIIPCVVYNLGMDEEEKSFVERKIKSFVTSFKTVKK